MACRVPTLSALPRHSSLAQSKLSPLAAVLSVLPEYEDFWGRTSILDISDLTSSLMPFPS